MIDWQRVTLNLRSRYKSLTKVAQEVGSDWAAMNRLARGDVNEPKFSVGVRLLDLHFDHCPDLHAGIKLNNNLYRVRRAG